MIEKKNNCSNCCASQREEKELTLEFLNRSDMFFCEVRKFMAATAVEISRLKAIVNQQNQKNK